MRAMRASFSGPQEPIHRCRESWHRRCSRHGPISRARAAPGTRATVPRSMADSTSTRAGRFPEGFDVSDESTRGHAALMDAVYRRQRYIYDFTRKYYLFGRDRLINQLALKPGNRLVEVGCGTARNLVKIARRYPGAHLFGLDASAEMLKTASASVARAGLEDRIKLAQGYAEALTPSLFGQTRPFDVALFSYSLSMIPDWKQALEA